jgi:hypothetical protein
MEWVFIVMMLALLVALGVVGGVVYVTRRRKRNSGVRQMQEDSACGPTFPILQGQTIRDIIEMTTSGSGSGMIFPQNPPRPKRINKFRF